MNDHDDLNGRDDVDDAGVDAVVVGGDSDDDDDGDIFFFIHMKGHFNRILYKLLT